MGRLSNLKRTARRALRRVTAPIRPEQLRSALERLTENRADVLFVHTSFAHCGHFTGGPQDVLRGLSEVCNTLSLPTHTYSYPVSIGEPGPLFDPAKTPSQSGLLTELFRQQPEAVRSIQATHSLAAAGPLADEITRDHYSADTPAGAETPYSRLLEGRASVLLFGVTFHSYTLFHTAEDASGSTFAYEKGILDRLRVIDETGVLRECKTRRQARNPRRFKAAGDLLERVGLVRRVELGQGSLLYVPDCAKAHDFLVERLRKTPDFLLESCRRSLE